MLAAPGQIESVTHLSADPQESALWEQARAYPANDGSLLSVAALRPDLIVTIGGGGRDAERIAKSLGAKLLRLPFVSSLAELRSAIATLGAALDRRPAAVALIAKIEALSKTMPRSPADTLFIDGAGRTVGADGIGAEWLAVAGLRSRPGVRRVSTEELMRAPPQVLVTSDYRAGQMSAERRWLDQPLLSRARGSRRIVADGRRWTCFGPTLIPEIERFRRRLRR